jgi:hypothetical protein
MSWLTQSSSAPLPWLLETDSPGVRYLALRDLLDPPPSADELALARAAACTHGPVAAVLNQMAADGFWVKAGPGYAPKYHSTVWSLILLAQLGASAQQDPRIERACGYLLDHASHAGGQISAGSAPSGTADCLQGNMCAALLDLDCADPRLDVALEWMARTVTGEGLAPASDRKAGQRYFASGKCGPDFACHSNANQSCGWGAAKVMLAFSKLPPARRTPLIERAIARGVEFLFSVDPLTAAYPTGSGAKPNRAWWQFGFPVFYITDVLQLAEALVGLGYGRDPRLAATLDFIRSKQDEQGRWLQEYSYGSKTWGDFGRRNQPNKWVTLRAARVLKAAA